jgi:hypothetical protein
MDIAKTIDDILTLSADYAEALMEVRALRDRRGGEGDQDLLVEDIDWWDRHARDRRAALAVSIAAMIERVISEVRSGCLAEQVAERIDLRAFLDGRF